MLGRYTARYSEDNNIIEVQRVIYIDSGDEDIEVFIDRKTTYSFILEWLPIAIKEVLKDDYNNEIVYNEILLCMSQIIRECKETHELNNVKVRSWFIN